MKRKEARTMDNISIKIDDPNSGVIVGHSNDPSR